MELQQAIAQSILPAYQQLVLEAQHDGAGRRRGADPGAVGRLPAAVG